MITTQASIRALIATFNAHEAAIDTTYKAQLRADFMAEFRKKLPVLASLCDAAPEGYILVRKSLLNEAAQKLLAEGQQ